MARSDGLTVEVGGDASQQQPEQSAAEVIGVVVAAFVLVITFGSLVAAGLPLLTALLGIAISIGSITALSGFVDLSSTTSTLALMLGLAVAIDYALFIVSRYRHELAAGREPEEAAGRAVGTAGSAVVFAGLTVVIALAALAVVGIPFMTQMGVAAAGTVAMAVVLALTLLPAMFGFVGGRITGGRVRGLRARDPEADGDTPNLGARWARAVVPPAGGGVADRRGRARGRRDSRPGPAAGHAGRQHGRAGHQPAQGVRPAGGRVRGRLQRPPDGRGRHQRRLGQHGSGEGDAADQGPRRRRRGHPGGGQPGRGHRAADRHPEERTERRRHRGTGARDPAAGRARCRARPSA